jgi:hypothetical protein
MLFLFVSFSYLFGVSSLLGFVCFGLIFEICDLCFNGFPATNFLFLFVIQHDLLVFSFLSKFSDLTQLLCSISDFLLNFLFKGTHKVITCWSSFGSCGLGFWFCIFLLGGGTHHSSITPWLLI